jgi:hypothetical protein
LTGAKLVAQAAPDGKWATMGKPLFCLTESPHQKKISFPSEPARDRMRISSADASLG